MNAITPQVVFIGFWLSLIGGVIWAIQLTVRRWKGKQNPESVFRSNADRELDTMEQRISADMKAMEDRILGRIVRLESKMGDDDKK